MFSERFKTERKKLGLTQQQISNKLGISRSNIANWENGVNEASNDMLLKCSELFGCSVDYLLGKNKFRNFEEYLAENKKEIENDMKVLRSIKKETYSELNLDIVPAFDKEDIDNENFIYPKSNVGILLDKLKELKLLKNDKELSDKELKIIMNFIENNKDMLKKLMID